MNFADPEWMQVYVGAVVAAATVAAVIAALWLPKIERRRASVAAGKAALALSHCIIDIHGRLDAEPLTFDPRPHLHRLRMLTKTAEVLVLRESAPASFIAVFMLQKPEIDHIDKALSEWTACLDARQPYDSTPLRQYLRHAVDRIRSLADVKLFAD